MKSRRIKPIDWPARPVPGSASSKAPTVVRLKVSPSMAPTSKSSGRPAPVDRRGRPSARGPRPAPRPPRPLLKGGHLLYEQRHAAGSLDYATPKLSRLHVDRQQGICLIGRQRL